MPPLPPSPPAHSTPIDKPLPPSPAPSPAHRPAPAPAPAMNPTYREMDIRDRPRAERDRRHPDTGTASDQVGTLASKAATKLGVMPIRNLDNF